MLYRKYINDLSLEANIIPNEKKFEEHRQLVKKIAEDPDYIYYDNERISKLKEFPGFRPVLTIFEVLGIPIPKILLLKIGSPDPVHIFMSKWFSVMHKDTLTNTITQTNNDV